MAKTKVIDPMVMSGNLSSSYLGFIKKYRNNPIFLVKFLNEINASINSKRRAWLIEQFDSAQKETVTHIELNLNLGIVIFNCQLQGFQFWCNQFNILSQKLADEKTRVQPARAEKSILERLSLSFYKKTTLIERLESELSKAHEQKVAALHIAHHYLSMLENIESQNDLPNDYKLNKFTTNHFILNLLMPKNGVSIIHLAAIFGDDVLLCRTLCLLKKINTNEDIALSIYNLLTKRLSFYHNPILKSYHNCTIGHCIALNAFKLQKSLHELLMLFSSLVTQGITAPQIRHLVNAPVADIESESITNFIYKHYAVLPQETRELFDNMRAHIIQDASFRHEHAMTPVPICVPLAHQAPITRRICSPWRPNPIFTHCELSEDALQFAPDPSALQDNPHQPEVNSDAAPAGVDVPSFVFATNCNITP